MVGFAWSWLELVGETMRLVECMPRLVPPLERMALLATTQPALEEASLLVASDAYACGRSV